MEVRKGAIFWPEKWTDLHKIITTVLNFVWEHGIPERRQFLVYGVWLAIQAVLFKLAPGPVGKGLPIKYGLEKGRYLLYKYNGQFAFFATIVLAVISWHLDIFKITELARDFGKYQTLCNLYITGLIAIIHVGALITNKVERPSGSIIYDYFMGPMLNPHLFGFDIKFFHELRPGIMHWFFTTIGFAILQYQEKSLTTPMVLVCFYHLCFVNACYKGEQCVPMSMDIIYEKFGFMLCFLDLNTVPFIFPLQAYYLYVIEPFNHSLPVTALLLVTHLLAYWIFDTANSQKDYFRASHANHIPYGFPHLPWGKLTNPKYMTTASGKKLLLDGWWAYSRHMNYLGDMVMSWVWGLTCGVNSYFPFAYTTYLTPLLIHRERRDHNECKKKYGQDWDAYCQKVPYRLIPYVY